MPFELDRVRLLFEARRKLCFAHWEAANLFRGALGLALPPRIFAPVQFPSAAGPSGFADSPRPFVIRAAHLNGRVFEQDDLFFVDLHIFNGDTGVFERAFRSIDPLHGGASFVETLEREHKILPLEPLAGSVPRVSVRFLSPTELKNEGAVAREPDFPILFSRAVNRLRSLSPTPMCADFRSLSGQAANVALVSHALIREKVERRSTRTGQTHSLGGFRGEASYEGELRELLPFLQAAQWTGVGRQTVWGKGEIEVKT